MKSLIACLIVACGASVAQAQNIRVQPNGLGGYRVYGSYRGTISPDNLGGYRGNLRPAYQEPYRNCYREPHLQYNPFTDSYHYSYGPKVGVYPWMFR